MKHLRCLATAWCVTGALPGVLSSQGALVVDLVRSPGLESNAVGDSSVRRVLVYLPPSYRHDPKRRYPVVYLLHGATSTPEEWLNGVYQGLNLQFTLDSLVAAAAIPEFLVVMPDADSTWSAAQGHSMTEEVVPSAGGHRWYSRPVLFVTDLHRALHFYVGQLGFEKNWHAGNGAGTVCQVSRSDCEIILCQDPARRDKARLFIELTADGLRDFRRELAERSVPTTATWWGYDTTQVNDPDGNELLFPVPE